MCNIKLSVVIPTHRKNDDLYLTKMVSNYPQNPAIEYIVVQSKTDLDRNPPITRKDFKVLITDPCSRAQKLNLGFKKAKGDILFFHHPRSLVDSAGLNYLAGNAAEMCWGGFTHKFDQSHPGLTFTSWYSNKVRPKLWRVLYLDHCIYFKKELLTRPIPDIPIFEDTELSYILRKHQAPRILPFVSETSAVRFDKNGFWKQGLMNQKLKLEFFLGRSKQKMNQEYEKNLNLNG